MIVLVILLKDRVEVSEILILVFVAGDNYTKGNLRILADVIFVLVL